MPFEISNTPVAGNPFERDVSKIYGLGPPVGFNPFKKSPGIIETAGRGIAAGSFGIGAGIGAATRIAGEVTGLEPVAEAGRIASEYWRARAGGVAPKGPEFTGTFVQNPSIKRAVGLIAQAVPSLGAALTIGTVAGPIAAAGALGVLEGAPQAEEALEAGETVPKAAAIGALSTAGTALLEFLPLSIFLKGLKGGVVTRALKGGAIESLQEPSQTLWQNLVAKYGFDKTQELAEGLVESAIAGGGAGALAGTVFKGVEPQDLEVARADIDKQIIDTGERVAAPKPAEVPPIPEAAPIAPEVAPEVVEPVEAEVPLEAAPPAEVPAEVIEPIAAEVAPVVEEIPTPEKVTGPPAFVPERIAREPEKEGAQEEADEARFKELSERVAKIQPEEVEPKPTPETLAADLDLEFIGESDGVSTFRRVVDDKETTTSVSGAVSRESLQDAISVQDRELAEFKERFPKGEPKAEKQISVTYRKSGDTHIVTAVNAEGKEVGKGRFVDKGENIKVEPGGILFVDPIARREGVATAIFNKAESETGKKVLRGVVQTGEGAAFQDAFFGAEKPPTKKPITAEPVSEAPTPAAPVTKVAAEAVEVEKEPWEMRRDDAIWGRFIIPSGTNTERALKAQVKLWQKRHDSLSDSEKSALSPETGILLGLTRAKEHLERANAHREAVQEALSEGKPVPESVLADYPDLTKERKKVEPKAKEETKREAVEPAETPIDPETLKPFTISQKVKHEETGKILTVKTNAAEVYTEATEKKSLYEQFLECLSK